MRISVEMPGKDSGMEAALLKQLTQVHRKLMGLVESQQRQQNSLLQAMKSMLHGKRMDSLESAQLNGRKRLHSRTFGSNF